MRVQRVAVVMGTEDTRLSVFSVTASSLKWHFSQENSIQNEFLAPHWSQIVAPSHMLPMGPVGVHQALLNAFQGGRCQEISFTTAGDGDAFANNALLVRNLHQAA